MKSYYLVQCEIEVEASDDDMALDLVQHILANNGLSMHRWLDTRLSERESTND